MVAPHPLSAPARRIVAGLALLLAAASAQASIVAEHDFEPPDNSLSGGSGWAADWSHSGSGGTFFSSGTGIDGDYAMGVFGNGGQALVARQISPTIDTSGIEVTANFSLRAAWDIYNGSDGTVSEMAVNILDGAGGTLLTFKFAEDDGITNMQLNDGGSDFTPSSPSAVSFAQGAVYDISFTSEIGSGQYSFTIAREGTSESASGTDFNYSGRSTASFGGLQFVVTAPSGAGNDGFIDSVTVSAIPEVSGVPALGAACAAGLLLHRRRRRRGR